MKRFFYCSTLLIFFIGCHHAKSVNESKNAAETIYKVGYSDLSSIGGSSSPFNGRIWYPISLENEVTPIPSSPIFHQYLGKKDAVIVKRDTLFPFLILSHGSGGAALRLDWMAQYFAEHGWIVVGINHPGNTFDDNSAEGLMQVWKRPKQISEFLDWFFKNYSWSNRIDTKQIAAAGHSAGGATVLMLAGARLSKLRLQNPVPFCVPKPSGLDDERCSELKKIKTEKYKTQDVEGDYYDPRVKAVIGLDPGFAKSFDSKYAGSLKVPVLLVLSDKLKSPEGQIYSHDLPNIFSGAESYIPPGSIHISFISSCSSSGLEKNLPICTGDEDRDQIHILINEHAYDFLMKVFRN